MGQINWTRVLLGGLLAGLIINIGEFVLNGMLLTEQWANAMQALNRPPDFTGTQIAAFNLLGFLTGIGGTWLYAAMRPRYGAGAKTALCAGAALWFLSYLLPSIGYAAIGLFPGRLIAYGTAWGLVELLVGIVAGAYLYKEEPASSGAKTAAAG